MSLLNTLGNIAIQRAVKPGAKFPKKAKMSVFRNDEETASSIEWDEEEDGELLQQSDSKQALCNKGLSHLFTFCHNMMKPT